MVNGNYKVLMGSSHVMSLYSLAFCALFSVLEISKGACPHKTVGIVLKSFKLFPQN